MSLCLLLSVACPLRCSASSRLAFIFQVTSVFACALSAVILLGSVAFLLCVLFPLACPLGCGVSGRLEFGFCGSCRPCLRRVCFYSALFLCVAVIEAKLTFYVTQGIHKSLFGDCLEPGHGSAHP